MKMFPTTMSGMKYMKIFSNDNKVSSNNDEEVVACCCI